ncbi:MAG: DUF1822 family protein [Synechococcus sp.]
MMYDSTYSARTSDECPDFGSIDNRNASRIDYLYGNLSGKIPLDRLVMEGAVSSGDWDFESLPTAGILLQNDGFQQAGRLSQSVVWPDRQWSVYQQGLAVLGLEEWLRLHSSLSMVRDRCSTFQPALANLVPAACNLAVGEFQLCAIPVGVLGDDRLEIPRAALDLPQFAAHFYVLVEVLEDCGYVQIIGVATRPRLLELCQQTEWATSDRGEESWSYLCSNTWFEYAGDDLLLWLRAANASQMELPPPAPIPPVSMQLRATLQQRQADLARRPIWQLLDWSEAMPLLVNPGWADWLLGTARGIANLPLPTNAGAVGSQVTSDRANSLGASGIGTATGIGAIAETEELHPPSNEQLLNRALNVGLWLHDRMETLAEELSWIMMAPFSPQHMSQSPAELAVGMRDIEDDVDTIVGQLLLDGLEIPTYACGAYRQVEWADRSLRLYAVTWPHLSDENVPEWTLLVVLGPTPGQSLPPLTRLRVRDASNLLVEQTSPPVLDDGYVYAHVVGTWDEQFWVTIDAGDVELGGELASEDGFGAMSSPTTRPAIDLPPFQFKPGVVQL